MVKINSVAGIQKSVNDDTDGRVLEVLQEAYEIYIERAGKYDDDRTPSWQAFGWRGSVLMVLHKTARIKQLFWKRETSTSPDVDDLLDAINYLAFSIINLRDGNEYGS